MLTNAPGPNKQTAPRLRSITHFAMPGAHVIRPKIDRVRRAVTTKQTTHNPANWGGSL